MTSKLNTQEAKKEVQHPVNREGISGAIQNTGDVFATIMKTVSEGISNAAKGTGDAGVSVLGAISTVVRTAVRESLGVGTDLIVGTKAIVVGVIRGTGEKEDAALKTLSNIVRTVIRQTAEMNGDVGAAATGLVLGAIASAEDMGVSPSKAASAARDAATEEGNRIGAAAAEKVRGALKQDIGGINFGSTGPLAT